MMTVKTCHDKTYTIQLKLSSYSLSLALKNDYFYRKNENKWPKDLTEVTKEQRRQEERYNKKNNKKIKNKKIIN